MEVVEFKSVEDTWVLIGPPLSTMYMKKKTLHVILRNGRKNVSD
jgi:hypothetical protein